LAQVLAVVVHTSSPTTSSMKGLTGCLLAFLWQVTALETAVKYQAEPSAVTRVVQLLQELQARIEQDGKDEQQAYDKYACWCETMTSKKAQSITKVKAELQSTGSAILRLKGTVATKSAEMKVLAEDIRKNEEAQKTATAIRQRENEAFVAEKAEMEQATTALEKAIIVLRDATETKSLLQQHKSRSSRFTSTLEDVMTTLDKISAKSPTRKLAALRTAVHRYAPQSATVQGILKDMYDTFVTNLETRTNDEAAAHRKYEDLMATYKTALLTLQDTLVKKEQAKAEAEVMLADASQAYADSEAQLKADIEFFDATKVACEGKTEEWSQRKTLRTNELDGIAQALTILSSDEAKTTFGKAFESFVQVQTSQHISPVKRAFRTLQIHSRQSHSLRLAALAAKLLQGRSQGVGHFAKVIEEIDKLMVLLQAEEQQDQRKVDDCNEQFQEIALSVQDLQWQIENNNAMISKLEGVITQKEAEKQSTLEEIKTVNAEMKSMQVARIDENAKFLTAKDDDQKAIELLEQAKAALSEYYKKNNVEMGFESLVQFRNETDLPPPEAKFSEKGSRSLESKGVIGILSLLIQDLKEEIASGIKAEEAAQLDYERQIEDAQKLRDRLESKKTNLEEAIALLTSDVSQEKSVLGEHQKDLTAQQTTEKDMKPSCDFAIKNQVERRRKRTLEMDGLRQAKEYLADARPAMLEVSKHGKARFDDNVLPNIDFEALA